MNGSLLDQNCQISTVGEHILGSMYQKMGVCTWLLGSSMHLPIASVGEKTKLDGLFVLP